MIKWSKVVRLKNVHLRIHACTESLDRNEDIKDAWAIIEVYGYKSDTEEDWRDRISENIMINGKEVYSLDEIPGVLEGGSLEILSVDADIIIYLPDKGKICKGFTDGEYAYMPCIGLDQIMILLDKAGLWRDLMEVESSGKGKDMH